MSLDLVPDECYVFRIVKQGPPHFPEGSERPAHAALRLREDDCEDARRRGVPAMLSVWDVELTSEAQARRYIGCAPSDVAFAWRAFDLRRCAGPAGLLEVYRDPINDVDGGEGHCGIAGLIVGAELPKKKTPNYTEYKKARERICSLMVPLPG